MSGVALDTAYRGRFKGLLGFAAITEEPLPEVADAGHDRTIVALRHVNVEAWLTPLGRSLDELAKAA